MSFWISAGRAFSEVRVTVTKSVAFPTSTFAFHTQSHRLLLLVIEFAQSLSNGGEVVGYTQGHSTSPRRMVPAPGANGLTGSRPSSAALATSRMKSRSPLEPNAAA